MLVRGIQFWNAEDLSLKENKLKYGAVFFLFLSRVIQKS